MVADSHRQLEALECRRLREPSNLGDDRSLHHSTARLWALQTSIHASMIAEVWFGSGTDNFSCERCRQLSPEAVIAAPSDAIAITAILVPFPCLLDRDRMSVDQIGGMTDAA